MMAQRKDMMRVLRQDAGFSATLEFGGASLRGEMVPGVQAAAARDEVPVAETSIVISVPATAIDGVLVTEPSASVAAMTISQGSQDCPEAVPSVQAVVKTRKEEAVPLARPFEPVKPDSGAFVSAARGQVVYIAVSLTARQAALAEDWANVARCSVQFLIRRVAQGLREQVCDDWEQGGMPDVDEPRGARGKFPTSVTLTLHPQFAADLAAKHDPLGIQGLARVMGPAFRARFHVAFDEALAKAKVQMAREGTET